MRIAIDILSAAVGGAAQYMVDGLPFFARQAPQDEFHVLASHPQLLPRLPRTPTIHVHEIPAGRRVWTRLPWQQLRLPRWLRDHGIDVLFAAQGITGLAHAVPIVVMHQDSMFFCRERYQRSRLYMYLQQLMTRRTLARAHAALFVSQAIADLAAELGWLRPGQARIVPYGIDIDALRAQADESLAAELRRQPPYLLTVSSVMPHKNVHTLVRAVRLLHDAGLRDARLLIAGEAPPDRPYANEIRALIHALGLEPSVTLLGHVARPQLAAYYRCARVYATLSTLEAYGLTLVEAMANGLPIVCSRLPAFSDVCGDLAVQVDAVDARAAATALAAAWRDDSLRSRMATEGPRRAARFSWPRAVEPVCDALHAAAR